MANDSGRALSGQALAVPVEPVAHLDPSGPSREDAVALADAIVRAWERESVPFDKAHEIQLALVAAQFLVRIANSRERAGV